MKFYSVSACLHIFTIVCALFPRNCTLVRRHNLTFEKGQMPSLKGLNIDSGWWLTDISFAKNDLTKEFPQDPYRCVREKPILHQGALPSACEDVWQAAINLLCSLTASFCLQSCQDSVTPFSTSLSCTARWLYRHDISWTLYLLNL